MNLSSTFDYFYLDKLKWILCPEALELIMLGMIYNYIAIMSIWH